MYEIDNISFKQYLELKDTSRYDIFINALNPKGVFLGKRANTDKLTFDEIEIVKGIFNNPTTESIKDLFVEVFEIKGDIKTSSSEMFFNASVFDVFRAKQYLQNWIVKLVETENNVLQSLPDEKLMRINAHERLRPVSHLLTKIKLAEQFSKTPNEIGKMKYIDVLSILIANKINNEIQMEYSQLK